MREWIEIDDQWRKTVIWGSPAAINEFIELLERDLPPGWRRARDAEVRYKLQGGASPSAYCFARSVEQDEVWLWLNQASPTRLIGANVIPSQRLSDYWRLAAETITAFRKLVLEPTAATTQVHIEENRIGLRSQVSPDVMESLWRFVDTAPRRFPLDAHSLPRWREFVIAARTGNAAFDPDEFAAWFEGKGWTRTAARCLAEKFYEDAWLLSDYDEARKPA